jgi:O-antigen/teichoic acid export membrane protein
MDRGFAIPSILIGQAISQVYVSRAARLATVDPAALRSLYSKCVRKLVLFGAAPFALVLVAGPQLFSLVFGTSWREAGAYAQILALAQFAGFVSWPLLPTLNILELQSWQFGWDVSRLCLSVGAVTFARSAGFSARGAISAYAVAMAASYLLHLIISYIAVIRNERHSTAGGEPSEPSSAALITVTSAATTL